MVNFPVQNENIENDTESVIETQEEGKMAAIFGEEGSSAKRWFIL